MNCTIPKSIIFDAYKIYIQLGRWYLRLNAGEVKDIEYLYQRRASTSNETFTCSLSELSTIEKIINKGA